jgi:integrase
MVAQLKREAGWPKRVQGLHGLRRRFASLQFEGSLPIREVAQALGHADARFTLRTHVQALASAGRRQSANDLTRRLWPTPPDTK